MTQSHQKETILIVEDDRSLREGLVMNFRLEGYEVRSAQDGAEGMKMAFAPDVDLIVLDLMLPHFSGLEILAELREKNTDVPVLILSARDQTRDKIEGLRVGADDYVTKPFELKELIARVDAMLRRQRSQNPKDQEIAFGSITVHPLARKVLLGGDPVDLSQKEFDLLLLLAKSPGRPFTREIILDRVWGWGFDGTTRTVDNFIMALRQKLEDEPSQPKHLQTVRKIGYKLEF